MKIDREKWNRRYSQESRTQPIPDEFLVQHRDLLTSGRALDLACGLGANSMFLAEQGYEVDAVDISSEAISRLDAEARSRSLQVRSIVADLDYFPLPSTAYDVVAVFYFFSAGLIQAIRDALKHGGLLFYATYNERHSSIMPTFNPAYLIPSTAIASYFADFNVLVHETSAGENGNISRIICRKS